MTDREWTKRACTHMIQRSDTSLRVYTTADTDTNMSTPCIGVPATYIIRPVRSLGQRSLYTMGGTLDH